MFKKRFSVIVPLLLLGMTMVATWVLILDTADVTVAEVTSSSEPPQPTHTAAEGETAADNEDVCAPVPEPSY